MSSEKKQEEVIVIDVEEYFAAGKDVPKGGRYRKGLSKPTVLMTATPYRNDLKLFHISDPKRYRAGGSQYLLVNQFVELAAKTDRWKSFKKGVEWALYLGISIRWLRDQEPTEESLQFVFAMMQKATYAQL